MQSLQSSFLRFVWLGKPAQLWRFILSVPKAQGSWGFPNPVKYHKATHLAWVIDWCTTNGKKFWVHLKQATINLPLVGLPWHLKKALTLAITHHPLMGSILQTIGQMFKSTSLSHHPSPLTPILCFFDFLPGVRDLCFLALHQKGSSQLLHFCINYCLSLRK